MRTFIRRAQWLALALMLALGLTACFQAAGEDLPPTQRGNIVPVNAGQQTGTLGPSPTALVQPTSPNLAPTVEEETPLPSPMVLATQIPTDVEQLGGTPTPTLTVTSGAFATSTPLMTDTPQPTFTPPPAQATFTPLPTYTSLPTYTPFPTFTEPPVEPTQPGIWPGGPTATYTPFPRVTFGPTPTYTLPPGASLPDGQGGFAGDAVVVQPQQPTQPPPQESVPLAEREQPTLAPGGVGGPVNPTPIAVVEPVSFSPTPIGGQPPVPTATAAQVAQLPTMSAGNMTATQLIYQATATSAAQLGLPSPVPPGMPTQDPLVQPPPAATQPVQVQPIQPGVYPPNATVITATPFGQPGICNEHLIQPGETLYRIALNYGVSADDVALQNNILNADLIEAGDTLLIPCYIPPSATPIPVPIVQGAPVVNNTTGGQTGVVVSQPQIYTVQAGDNIYQISLRFGVDMSELVAANGLNAVTMNTISVGQQLVIPGTAAIIVTATPIGVPTIPAGLPTATPYIIIVTSAP